MHLFHCLVAVERIGKVREALARLLIAPDPDVVVARGGDEAAIRILNAVIDKLEFLGETVLGDIADETEGVKRTGVVDYILRRGHKGLVPAEKIGGDLRIRNGDKGHIRLLGFDGRRRRGGCRRAVRRIEEREEQRKDLH